jgi:hypothetical protein
VKYGLIAAIALAFGLSVATAVPAGAATRGIPQVNGDLLLYAMPPASAFGSSYTTSASYGTGRKLLSTRARYHVPSMSCLAFESYTRVGVYGDTAGAWDAFYNPDWRPQWPTVLRGLQAVNQFASDGAAMTFYRQVLAKYQACQDFTEPNPGDHNPGGGTVDVSATSVTKTLIGRNLAFQVVQDSAFSELSGEPVFLNALYVVSGDDVYHFWDLSATNDEPWPGLMAQLIGQVQKLYPRG